MLGLWGLGVWLGVWLGEWSEFGEGGVVADGCLLFLSVVLFGTVSERLPLFAAHLLILAYSCLRLHELI